MELTTIIGIFLGVICVVVGIMMDGSIGDFLNPASFAIVVGGVAAATIASYPMDTLKDLAKIISKSFVKTSTDADQDIEQIISLANVARRKGVLALEDEVSNSENAFLKKGVMLVVDGTDPQVVRNVMETELALEEERHQQGQNVLNSMSTYSPAFGMIGTLIGLINMLGVLDDPSSLGPGMAVALITTLYGVLLANLLFSPMAKKLKVKGDAERLSKEILLEGVLSIQDGENPRIIREKLYAFLSRSKLVKLEAKAGQEGAKPETVNAGETV